MLPLDLRHDAYVDASIWVGAASGVIGAATGGGLSIWASLVAQKFQARSNRESVVAQRIDAAADLAIKIFFEIKQHYRERPSDFQSGAREHIEVWFKSLKGQLHKLEPILLRLRNEELRVRLTTAVEYMTWKDLSERELGGSAAIISELCDHALECLGAFVRDEPVPEEGEAIRRARQVEATYLEIMEEEAREWERQHPGGT